MTTSVLLSTRCGVPASAPKSSGSSGALMRFWYVRGYLREGLQPVRGGARCARRPVAVSPEGTLRGQPPCPPAGRLPERAMRSRRSASPSPGALKTQRAVASSVIGLGMSAQGLGDHERAAAAYTEGAELARARWLHLVPRDRHQQPGAISPWSRATTRRRGLASRKASNSSARSATSERSRAEEQTRSALASELGEEHFAAALLIGREMTFEQTVAYALPS